VLLSLAFVMNPWVTLEVAERTILKARTYRDTFACDLLVDLRRGFPPFAGSSQNEQGVIIRQLEGLDSIVGYLTMNEAIPPDRPRSTPFALDNYLSWMLPFSTQEAAELEAPFIVLSDSSD
jgi:hypothetical protein